MDILTNIVEIFAAAAIPALIGLAVLWARNRFGERNTLWMMEAAERAVLAVEERYISSAESGPKKLQDALNLVKEELNNHRSRLGQQPTEDEIKTAVEAAVQRNFHSPDNKLKRSEQLLLSSEKAVLAVEEEYLQTGRKFKGEDKLQRAINMVKDEHSRRFKVELKEDEIKDAVEAAVQKTFNNLDSKMKHAEQFLRVLELSRSFVRDQAASRNETIDPDKEEKRMLRLMEIVGLKPNWPQEQQSLVLPTT